MKRVLLPNGWDEVTTKQIRVLFKAKQFHTAGKWLDFTTREPRMNFDGRNHCQRCGCKWCEVDSEMLTYFVMTDKGNKVVCQKCWDELEGKGLDEQKP